MAVGDVHVFPDFLTPVLTRLFFPKPPTAFLTCFCTCERRKYASSVYRRDPLLFILGPLYREFQDSFEYKMSSIAHVFWTVKRYKRNHKKFLLKNFFPKNNKEKNFVNNSDAHDPMHAFSKIYIDHLRVIRSLRAICGPSARHLIFKYRTSKTQKKIFFILF